MRRTGRHGVFPQPGDAERQPEAMAQFARPSLGQAVSFSGRWINHLGSVLELAIEGGSASGRIEFRPDAAQMGRAVGALRGMVEGTTIALTSRWDGLACLGTWLGELMQSDGQDVIMFSWELVRCLDDPEQPMNQTMGQATFIRLASH